MKFINKLKLTIICLLVLLCSLCLSACTKEISIVDDYVNSSLESDFSVYNGVTLDGKIDDVAWEEQEKLSFITPIAGIDHSVEVSARYSDEGLAMYFKVSGAPVYFNSGRSDYHNTGIELYIASADAGGIANNAWQIELFPSGHFNTGKNIKTGVDNDSTYRKFYYKGSENHGMVEGKINTVESSGYTLEYFLPWGMFDTETAPEAMAVNFAVIYCATYEAPSRDAWINMGERFLDTYSWSYPSTWWKFTEKGFYDQSAPMLATINGGTGVENGSVSVSGNYESGGIVSATPDEGYVLDFLKVSGKDVDFLEYAFSSGEFYQADIEVGFRPESGKEASFKITGGFAYANEFNLSSSAVTLMDENGVIYSGKTDDNGNMSVKLPDGEYSVICNGYKTSKVTVNHQSASSYSVKLDREVMANASYDGFAVTDNAEDGAKIVFSGESYVKEQIPSVEFAPSVDYDFFLVDFVLEISASNNTWLPVRFVQSGKNQQQSYYLNTGIYSKKLCFKLLNQDKLSTEISTPNYDSNSDQVNDAYRVRIIVSVCNNSDGTSTLSAFYFENGETGNLKHIATATGAKVVSGFFMGPAGLINGPFVFDNIKIYDGEEAFDMAFSEIKIGDTADSDVVFEKSVVAPGNTVMVTVTPKTLQTGTNIIDKILVNGDEVDFEFGENGAKYFYIDNKKAVNEVYTIDVETRVVSLLDVTLLIERAGVNAVDGFSSRDEFTLSGPVFDVFTVNDNGEATLALCSGEYVLSAEGYIPTTVSVTDDTSQVNAILAKNIFNDNPSYTIDYNEEEGYNITNRTNRSLLDFNSEIKFDFSKAIVLEFDYENQTVANSKFFPTLRLYGKATNGRQEWIVSQMCVWNDQLHWKSAYSTGNTGEELVSGSADGFKGSFRYVIVKETLKDNQNNDVEAYVVYLIDSSDKVFQKHFAIDNPKKENGVVVENYYITNPTKLSFYFNIQESFTEEESYKFSKINVREATSSELSLIYPEN